MLAMPRRRRVGRGRRCCCRRGGSHACALLRCRCRALRSGRTRSARDASGAARSAQHARRRRFETGSGGARPALASRAPAKTYVESTMLRCCCLMLLKNRTALHGGVGCTSWVCVYVCCVCCLAWARSRGCVELSCLYITARTNVYALKSLPASGSACIHIAAPVHIAATLYCSRFLG